MGGLQKEPVRRKETGTTHPLAARISRSLPTSTSRWNTMQDTIKRQAVVNAGVTFVLRNQTAGGV